MNQKEKWYNHGWMYVIGGVVLAPVGTIVFDWIKQIPFLSTLKHLLFYKIEMWVGISIVIITFLISVILISRIKAKYTFYYLSYYKAKPKISLANNAEKKSREQEMLAYRADKFEGLIWVWEWIYNDIISRHEAKNAVPLCPDLNCKNQKLADKGYDGEFGYHEFKCLNCKLKYQTQYSPQDIEEDIENKYFTN
jgi:hypothetical protein